MDSLSQKITQLLPNMIACRRDLHKHAEAAWTEFRTASLVAQKLKDLGYTLTLGEKAVDKHNMMGVPTQEVLKKHQERAIAQGADPKLVAQMTGGLTGLWADLKLSGDGPSFALRFDMDSNDVVEATTPSHRPTKEGFASINTGAMHACGHDGHVAVGLAVAEVIVAMKDELKGSVRLIFQSAEEGVRGAAPMVNAGCVTGIDYIVGLHIGFQAAKKGDIVCGAKGFLATTKWDVTFTGKSAHAGAAPQEGKNALLAACAATTNLHAISRNSEGVTRITVGKLVSGQGRNIIPANAFVALETRGETSDLDDYMTKEARRIIAAAASMWDCEYEITVMGGTKSGESSQEMVDRISKVAHTMPVFTNVVGMRDFGASEDFSHMMTVVQQNGGQGSYVQVGIDKTAGHHNDHFDFDESDLATSAEVIIRIVQDYLKK